jgi:hypothetical protein
METNHPQLKKQQTTKIEAKHPQVTGLPGEYAGQETTFDKLSGDWKIFQLKKVSHERLSMFFACNMAFSVLPTRGTASPLMISSLRGERR